MILRRLAAEFFGTYCLVFAGTGAIVVNQLHGGVVTHVGVALTFGLIVLSLIYALGDVSGCHINPAVTIGFWAAGRLPGRSVAPYVVSQCAGAILASLTLRLMFPSADSLGGTTPAGGDGQAFVMEFILTLMLMAVVLGVSSGAKETGALAGVAVGGLIALEALFGGPVSGASMNPARSLGPAVVSLHMKSLWIYLVAPVAGAIAGVLVDRVIRGPGDPRPPAA
jgi:aquaporin Z